MRITKDWAAQKISGYLRHELSEAELVDWPENALMTGGFEATLTLRATSECESKRTGAPPPRTHSVAIVAMG